jgi:hypothetical protein
MQQNLQAKTFQRRNRYKVLLHEDAKEILERKDMGSSKSIILDPTHLENPKTIILDNLLGIIEGEIIFEYEEAQLEIEEVREWILEKIKVGPENQNKKVDTNTRGRGERG